jgi:glutamate-1-semialdehyde 2,1-aminomutase
LATFGVSTSAGIPPSFAEETLVIPLNDREALTAVLEKHAHETACVIIEPVPANNGLLLQDKSFLECLRLKCYQHDVLLIFDEVISGFRVGFEGAAGYYGIQPDIITYGKIIGGGMPVGAYGASHEIMSHIAPDGPVYQAGTLSANPVAMSAGYAAMQQLLKPGFYESMEERTKKFAAAISSYADEKGWELTVPSIASIFWLCFSKDRITKSSQIDAAEMEKFKVLHHELLQSGIYLGPSGYEVGFISAAHDDASLAKALEAMKRGLDLVFG